MNPAMILAMISAAMPLLEEFIAMGIKIAEAIQAAQAPNSPTAPAAPALEGIQAAHSAVQASVVSAAKNVVSTMTEHAAQ